MDNIKILENQFFNTNIIEIIPSQKIPNFQFQFTNISFNKNLFHSISQQVFLSILYTQILVPLHELYFQSFQILNNQYKNSHSDLKILVSQLIRTQKIAQITLKDIIFEDHMTFSLGNFEDASQIDIQDLKCQNSLDYNSQYKLNDSSSSCFDVYNIPIINLDNIVVLQKYGYNTNLVNLVNQIEQKSQISIKNSVFQKISLIQSFSTYHSNPLFISLNQIGNIFLENLVFSDNTLQGILKSQKQSTTCVYISSLLSIIYIKKSKFENMLSSNDNNCLFFEIQELYLEKSLFKNASNLNKNENMLIQGGFMKILSLKISIQSTEFSQSYSKIGSFIYFMSFEKKDVVFQIENSIFQQGFATENGSAFYIDTLSQKLILDINNCIFQDLFLQQLQNSTSIYIRKDIAQIYNIRNIINLKNTKISNIYGIQENQFLDLQNSDIYFYNIIYFFQLSLFLQNQEINYQHALFLNGKSLNLTIQEFLLEKITIIKNQKNLLLFDIQDNNNSNFFQINSIKIQNTIISSSGLLKIDGGSVSFENLHIENVQINKNIRNLQENNLINIQQFTINLIKTQLIIKNSFFLNIQCPKCTGGVFYIQKSSIQIENSDFKFCQSSNGGALFIENPIKKALIFQSTFINNRSEQNGGSLYIIVQKTEQLSLQIQSSNFQQNIAQQGGGAINISFDFPQENLIQTIQIINSQFSSNMAYIGGGILYQKAQGVHQNTLFLNNSALLYGKNYFSQPSRLQLLNKKDIEQGYEGIVSSNSIFFGNWRSGKSIKQLILGLFDDQNEQMILEQNSDQKLQLLKLDQSNITYKNSSYQIEYKGFEIKEIQIVGRINERASISIKNQLIRDQQYEFQLIFQFRKCKKEEQLSIYNNLQECTICPQAQYSFGEPCHVCTHDEIPNCQLEINKEHPCCKSCCKDCPFGAICNYDEPFKVRKGFWRSDKYSSIIIECKELPENCQEGTYANYICFQGHIGAKCDECDLLEEYWDESYTKTGKFSCSQCSKIQNNSTIVILLTLWTMISMTLAIKINQAEYTAIYIKILTNYFQIIGSVASFDLSVPSGIFEFPDSVGQPVKQTMNSLDYLVAQLISLLSCVQIGDKDPSTPSYAYCTTTSPCPQECIDIGYTKSEKTCTITEQTCKSLISCTQACTDFGFSTHTVPQQSTQCMINSCVDIPNKLKCTPVCLQRSFYPNNEGYCSCTTPDYDNNNICQFQVDYKNCFSQKICPQQCIDIGYDFIDQDPKNPCDNNAYKKCLNQNYCATQSFCTDYGFINQNDLCVPPQCNSLELCNQQYCKDNGYIVNNNQCQCPQYYTSQDYKCQFEVSWQNCIVSPPSSTSCPSECIAGGYKQDPSSGSCISPTYDDCFAESVLECTKACQNLSGIPVQSGKCVLPPACQSDTQPCNTLSPYCQIAGFSTQNNTCNCSTGFFPVNSKNQCFEPSWNSCIDLTLNQSCPDLCLNLGYFKSEKPAQNCTITFSECNAKNNCSNKNTACIQYGFTNDPTKNICTIICENTQNACDQNNHACKDQYFITQDKQCLCAYGFYSLNKNECLKIDNKHCFNDQANICPQECLSAGYSGELKTACGLPAIDTCLNNNVCDENVNSFLSACVNVGFYNKSGSCKVEQCVQNDQNNKQACSDACLSIGYQTLIGNCQCVNGQIDAQGKYIKLYWAKAIIFDQDLNIIAQKNCPAKPEELKPYLTADQNRDNTIGAGFILLGEHYDVHRFHPPLIYGRRGDADVGEGISLSIGFSKKANKTVYLIITYELPIISARAVPQQINFYNAHIQMNLIQFNLTYIYM
ncbi:hypothetical protein IMG5_199750 [Ichthyophthirius multifiliis]|uniref:Uncharacterized protein n=1 Tax=Ichthyophthirius multifiliis TaxID=5932 RepID=G0R5M6_ICHMU|nr:hypothetical protein IMG5_199750 [Ichthyophthirius multifiliis]EGR27234.1 hypothetical protein IMG5_199750 [Ichthyophthirius multifiliis]|eukprot:XP_004024118.1 hypothetical protein IMG5_199750 [Ichthyophthirius multifiliis]